jgi:hypothetical protein
MPRPRRPPPRKSRPIEEVQALMDDIRSRAADAASVDDLHGPLGSLLDAWRHASITIATGNRLYRAQKPRERPPNLSRTSYPPPSCVLEDGRCNRAGESVFYASASRQGAAYESRPTEGERICVVHYTTTHPLPVMPLGYTTTMTEALGSARPLPAHAMVDPPVISRQDRLIREFLDELFTATDPGEEHWRYRITIAIAEILRRAPVSGLLYPTIAMRANSDNFALKPYVIDRRHLRPYHAEWLEVTGIEESTMSVTIADEARTFAKDGSIGWLGHLGQWTLEHEGDELLFEALDHHWIARNKYGQIVHPR